MNIGKHWGCRQNTVEADAYEESLMVYRDLKNSLDTAREGGAFEKAYKTAEVMIKSGEPDEKIKLYTGLSTSHIRELRTKFGL
jgi:hypothetical protein